MRIVCKDMLSNSVKFFTSDGREISKELNARSCSIYLSPGQLIDVNLVVEAVDGIEIDGIDRIAVSDGKDTALLVDKT